MKKLTLFSIILLSMTNLLVAMEQQSESLVVGSNRKAAFVGFWWLKIQGKGNDFTHATTFDGKALSLDLTKSNVLGLPHRIVDARTYKPAGKIEHVFMELFPSAGGGVGNKVGTTSHCGDDLENAINQLGLMPDTIKNLALYMSPKCTLEIEHIPHSAYIEKEVYAKMFQVFQSYNPFHSFISPYAIDALKARHIDLVNNTRAYKEYWDVVLKRENKQYEMLIKSSAFNIIYLKQAIDFIKLHSRISAAKIEQRIDEEIKLCEGMGWPEFLDSYGPKSVITCVTQIASIYEQQGLIISFLEENGFSDVKVEIKDNKYNGRKNVFMISAIKSDPEEKSLIEELGHLSI